jgi:hypothetical protein
VPDTALNHSELEPAFREVLSERCGGREACTRFIAERLTAKCSTAAGWWSLEADAFSVALLYGIKSGRVAHEVRHVEDMRDDVTRHLRDLELNRYPTQEACSAAATAAMRDFSAAMKRFARQSMEKRH